MIKSGFVEKLDFHKLRHISYLLVLFFVVMRLINFSNYECLYDPFTPSYIKKPAGARKFKFSNLRHEKLKQTLNRGNVET